MSREPYSYRHDPAIPAFPDDRPIIVFDGNCAFCSRWVQFVLRHDRDGRYRFITGQSDLGRAIYRHYGLSDRDFETNILIEDGVALFKAEGTMQMISGLGFPWKLVNLYRVLPPALRDWGYSLVARNRIRWFGSLDRCFRPQPEHAARFLG
jgi:predicted DCC family thiol-disulfide oxidoreductase YuxK